MRKRLVSFASDFINIFILKKTPCFYYNEVDNVGDKLNSYLLQKVTGKPVYIVKTKRFSHFLPTGSILHFSSESSYVWGSGLISPTIPEKVRFAKILALRGFLTLSEVKKQTNRELNVPLGDPGLLMPRYYKPRFLEKRYRIGIVPHYADEGSKILEACTTQSDVKIISVRQDYKNFIDDLVSCDYILSSSLHGLILSDAYGIPNKWIAMSHKIIGGEFKFKDYYSTTTQPEESCVHLESSLDMIALTDSISSRASIKKYEGDLDQLESVCEIE